MAQDIIGKYRKEKRLNAEQYIEILVQMGGDATTREIADAAGRRQETVARTLGQHFDEDSVETINGTTVKKVTRGATHVYKVLDDTRSDGESGES